jgi:hypothetical protein
MKPIVAVYCEGTDTKLAVISKKNGEIKVHRTLAEGLSHSLQSSTKTELMTSLDDESSMTEDLSFDSIEEMESEEQSVDSSDIGHISAQLSDIKLNKLDFIPIVTEPGVNFHTYEGPRDKNKKKLIESIIEDIQISKNITVAPDSVDCIDINGDGLLSVFLEGEVGCVNLINLLANYNSRRFYKIPTIKTAELSLAYYVAKTTKFFPEDYSLIIYIGKEYSKLIFLEGQKLKHIGTTLDIGTNNLHTYDVYFSKILLEMENGSIPKLDNVVLCGEDRSENLVLSFYGTFPEANVTELEFEDIDASELDEETKKNLSLFSIPIAVAVEYFDEQEKEYSGVNFLPQYVVENQKMLQFAWHSYALMPILFATAFFFTYNILSNFKKIDELDVEIQRLTQRQIENQALVEQITPLEAKINSFDNTKAILDSAAIGTGVWSDLIEKTADFIERRRNFWITKLEKADNDIVRVQGYSLSRSVLTEFADYNNSSLLQSVIYDPLREKSAFAYTLNFKLSEDSLGINGN